MIKEIRELIFPSMSPKNLRKAKIVYFILEILERRFTVPLIEAVLLARYPDLFNDYLCDHALEYTIDNPGPSKQRG